MGKINGPNNPDYPVGTYVRVASRDDLLRFLSTWRYHNKLDPKQVEYAGRVAQVETVGFYHGGYELYKLSGIPGIWHEVCLEPALSEPTV